MASFFAMSCQALLDLREVEKVQCSIYYRVTQQRISPASSRSTEMLSIKKQSDGNRHSLCKKMSSTSF